jgi:hypothetical protein
MGEADTPATAEVVPFAAGSRTVLRTLAETPITLAGNFRHLAISLAITLRRLSVWPLLL